MDRDGQRERGRLNESGMRGSRERTKEDERRGVRREIKADERKPLLPQFRAALRVTDEMQRYCRSLFEATALSTTNAQYQIAEIKCGRFTSLQKHRCHGTKTTGDGCQRAGPSPR